jgi:hypothetical protein
MTEVEYITLSEAVKEVVWTRKFFLSWVFVPSVFSVIAIYI